MTIESGLESISNRLEKVEDRVEETQNPKAHNKSYILVRIFEIFVVLFTLNFILKSNLLISLPNLVVYIIPFFLSWNPYFEGLATIYASIISFLIYWNIFFYGILSTLFFGIVKTSESIKNNFAKYQGKVLIIIVILFSADIIFLNGDSPETTIDELRSDWTVETDSQQSKWSLMTEKITCSFNVPCAFEQKQVNKVDTIRSTSYSIDLNQEAILSTYNSDSLKTFPITFDVEAKGKGILLDKIECYHENKNEENLISTTNLENREIKYENKRSIPGIYCDLSSLDNEENKEKMIKIYPVLYYTILTEFTQEIPFVDFEEFSLKYRGRPYFEIENAAREEYPLSEGEKTTDILDIQPILKNPEPPILLRDENFVKNMIFQVRFRAQSSTLGIVEQTRIISMTYPELYLRLTSEPSFPMILGTTEGESSLSLPFVINNEVSLNGAEISRESISFDVETQMKWNKEKFEFMLS